MRIEFEPGYMPSKIVCVGRNYAAHAAELGNEVPTEPLLFLKAPSSLLLPIPVPASANSPDAQAAGSTILLPPQSSRVEHEGELGLIIGKPCRNIRDDEDWHECVRGYTCLNDVTARDLQKRDVQFARAKSFDTFCPVGPWIETDLDVTDLSVVTRVNGEVRQSGRTSEMVFGVGYLIRYISRMMTLVPGDLIATGTPEGVGPLVEGDTCSVEIERIGTLRNTIANARA